ADREPHPVPLGERGIERLHGGHYPQTSPHSALGIVFMRLRITKIDEQAIAQVLRNMAVKARNDRGTGRLIGPDYVPPVLGIKLAGEGGRIHQVTKYHGELASSSLRRRWRHEGGALLGTLRSWGSRVRRRRGRHRRHVGVLAPEQPLPVGIGNLRM